VAPVRVAQTPLSPPADFFRALWAALIWGLLLSGCSTPVPERALLKVPSPAHLLVINHTNYAWHIVIRQSSGEPAHDSRLESRGTVAMNLPGGDYVIEQTVLSEKASPELSRKISARLEAGKTYRWRLVTLLSEPDAGDDGTPTMR
jgi:hypothetical protein